MSDQEKLFPTKFPGYYVEYPPYKTFYLQRGATEFPIGGEMLSVIEYKKEYQ
jgi:hypothetical protein